MDALSNVLSAVSLHGAVYVNAEFTAPWSTQGSGRAVLDGRVAATDHVMFFHFLTEGCFDLRLADSGAVVHACAGDLVLFPHDDRHVMGSHLHLAPVETNRLVALDAGTDGDFIRIRHGGGGAVTRCVCGYLVCSPIVCRRLLAGLPRVLHVPLGDGQTAALLRGLLQIGVRESIACRPGAGSMLAKLAELIFVEALRRYAERPPPEGKGWLAGVHDPHVGRALALLHADPGRTWTVDALAREVALSRSALAERFSALVGEPPMQYLMRWRLAVAARALRSGREAVARVAERSGYESEAAFTRAFKREFGMPPTAWRRNGRQARGDAVECA